jgi:type I restriction-modification system DNA methylase subunit
MYNFTIDESTSIDVEISVDPEMLGRIFENLLAEINPETGETARKATGSYYTPRPIVEYMVDESLKQYLKTKTDIDEGRLSQLLSYAEDDTGIAEDEKDLLINALDLLKIIDPACGSGAFPMGILHKMLLILQKIDPKSSKWLLRKLFHIENKVIRDEIERKLKRENWDYVHKLGIIQNSIYGVDIQPIAVEISKLRFFLSLIVDEMIDDTKPNRGIEPLPNLEFKFVAANSLIGLPKVESSLAESHSDIEKLRELREEYFTSFGDKKRRIEKEFKETQKNMFLHSLNWQTTTSQTYKLSEWNPFADTASSWFDPEWMFGIREGFDAIIANPPYLRIQEIQKTNPDLAENLKEIYHSASGSFDIYAVFVEFAINHMGKDGNIAYILPHKFFQAAFGKNLRKLISYGKLLRKIVDFGSSQVFESATTYTCLLFLSKNNKNFVFAELKPNVLSADLPNIFSNINQSSSFSSDAVDVVTIDSIEATEKEWYFSAGRASSILSKLRKQPRTLADVCEKIFVGLQTSADKIYFLKHIAEHNGTVSAFSESLNKEVAIERGIVKPLLKGADVHRYAKLEPKIWCIFPYRIKENKAVLYTQAEIQKQFPKAWDYLLDNRKALEKRENSRMAHDEFYAYIYPKNLTEFERGKIVTPEISYGCNMTYDSQGIYHNTKCYSFVFKKTFRESQLFYLALLNSKVLWFFLTSTGYVLRGGYFVFKTNYLMPFPIPMELPQENQMPFIRLVEYILYLKKHLSSEEVSEKKSRDNLMAAYFEQLIDAMVYELYFEDEMKQANKQFNSLLIKEKLPDIRSQRGSEISELRSIFERLFDAQHPLRKNLFFLDSMETVRIIEGKNED